MSVPILSSIFGEKPNIAPFHPIDFGESQLKSILANLKAFPQIQALGDYFQDYMMSAYDKAIPNFSKLLEMGGESAESILEAAKPLIQGEIPEDVKAQIMRSGAFQALGKGGDFLHSLQARDLGRTSLDLMGQGANLVQAGGSAAQQWASLADKTIMNPAGMLITPRDQANLDLQQSLIKREVQQARENVKAAPDPIMKGLSDLVAYLTASYIGRGPAGKPPDATSYENATTLNAGGSIESTQKSGLFGLGPSTTTTTGPLEDVSFNNFTPEGGSFGGAGAGSDYSSYGFGNTPMSGSTGLPGSISLNDLSQAVESGNLSPQDLSAMGLGGVPANPFNPDYYNFSNNVGMFPQQYNPGW